METMNSYKGLKELSSEELMIVSGGGWFFDIGKAIGKYVAETKNRLNESWWNEAFNYELGSGTIEAKMGGL